jgi:ribosomal protein L29
MHAETSAVHARDLQTACDQLTETLQRLEAKDASGPLDQRHELSIMQTRRELAQKTAVLATARPEADRLHRVARTAADDAHRLAAELWKYERDAALLADETYFETANLPVREWRRLQAVHRAEIQRLAGAPAASITPTVQAVGTSGIVATNV